MFVSKKKYNKLKNEFEVFKSIHDKLFKDYEAMMSKYNEAIMENEKLKASKPSYRTWGS